MGHAAAEAIVKAGLTLVPFTLTGYSAGVAVSNIGAPGKIVVTVTVRHIVRISGGWATNSLLVAIKLVVFLLVVSKHWLFGP